MQQQRIQQHVLQRQAAALAAALAAKPALAASSAEVARWRTEMSRDASLHAELRKEMPECTREIGECIEGIGGDEFGDMCATVASIMQGFRGKEFS